MPDPKDQEIKDHYKDLDNEIKASRDRDGKVSSSQKAEDDYQDWKNK